MENVKKKTVELIVAEDEGLVQVTDYTTRMRSFNTAREYYDLLLEVDKKMDTYNIFVNAERKILKRYWIVVDNILEKYKETLYKYIERTNKNAKDDIQGVKIDTWKNWNKQQRTLIDSYKGDITKICDLLVDAEVELQKFNRIITKEDKKNLDRIYSLIIYGHNELRKSINRKHTNGANPPLHQSKKELVMIRRAKTKKARFHECDWRNKRVNEEFFPTMIENNVSNEHIDLMKTHLLVDPTKYKKSKLVKGINRVKKACLLEGTNECEFIVAEVNKFFKIKTGIQSPFSDPRNDKYKQPKVKGVK
jgi:hypothetical protein